MSNNYEDKIFLIEVEKIKPNPYQPRREFNEERLRDLADSIKQYGVLQPLVVTRKEVGRDDGSFFTEYEIIAGERRWRASKLAGLPQVPAIIRTGEQSDKEKLELAIIENLQREDLNSVDRAQAFFRLVSDFGLSHGEVGKRVGRSREYVSNTIRILNLPQEILDALVAGQIAEGHTKPLLMLSDHPEEQITIFKEVMIKRLTVRDTEAIARRIAYDRVRKKEHFVMPEIIELEDKLSEKYGNRVKVEAKGETGGRILIDFTSPEELRRILSMLEHNGPASVIDIPLSGLAPEEVGQEINIAETKPGQAAELEEPEDLYFIKNFSL
ncbi:MAG: ParB/RepB/Spo0J family partition protein [Candidatus Paceibacterota bacterium]|jgi:ParB family chromosome partitioning protein